ncbi:excinuclease ABC subunit UvrA [Acetobacter oeni]|uniref:UvrABC system protein A n=1 Tax=Acetobacter oeni TaxID=304077 RepID=A0A511XMJ9_9PROT|nr:excinuclease ABC subunit UvrA [Acetobacter oeni]MBB3882006.1 excinuclease ABC subunit A [Acetobacter oeni]NHO17677.1 ATP-binding cassette domain-containing protein [Acetobacter oeni]GBR00291.1 excinuclease ABC subunit A [Acetobacter oeni LMG 21952]GEN64171.1 UvrABC system protein A [Acetobacter oeni]
MSKVQTPPGLAADSFVRVRGAREHNLRDVNVDIPRDKVVVFTGVSGSGKSSLAFGTLYAEAQRRYLESVSPYARRLFQQMPVPEVDSVDGLPPAIALQQQRGGSSGRSSVGSITTLSNLLRMLYSRAGTYPAGLERLEAEAFSPNTPMGACKTCHGLGRILDVTETSMVPDDSLSIRNRAVASWPTAWQGQNLRDILITMGVDVDCPWRDLPRKTRDWILYTDETPAVPVYPGLTHEEVQEAIGQKKEPGYNGTFTGARRYILQTFARSQSATMRKRAESFMTAAECPECHGQRLNADALRVTFGGLNIAQLTAFPLEEIAIKLSDSAKSYQNESGSAKIIAAQRIVADMSARIGVLLHLGLGYLQMDRGVQTLSPGEYQRLRLGTQIYSNLFGVVYVLDEPSSGLHPADTEALLEALSKLKAAGNSLFLVEHNLDIIRQAEWIVDVGPMAGEAGGEVLYSGPPDGLRNVAASRTRTYLFSPQSLPHRTPQTPTGWLKLNGIYRNNLNDLSVSFPLGVFTSVTGVSGSGKSSLVSQVLTTVVAQALGQSLPDTEDGDGDTLSSLTPAGSPRGRIISGLNEVHRLVVIDQKPIGRTPRSNLATYTGLFDTIRKIFARTKLARERKYDAGWFSFNIAKGRCPHCEGAGSVMVELLFLPGVYAPCPVCHGSRYKPEVLEVTYRGKSIADVLAMNVEEAAAFFADDPAPSAALLTLMKGGLGHLRLGQPATELSGGEAQRIKLATELQKQRRGHTLYVLDEPTTGLHPLDVDRLMDHLQELVDSGNTVIAAEHDMRLVARGDWVIDMGPGAGSRGGHVVAAGTPSDVAATAGSMTAPFLQKYIT